MRSVSVTIKALYFSPTGGTKLVTTTIAGALSRLLNIGDVREIDVTPPGTREADITFGGDDLAVIAFPTYAGRLPNKIMPFVRDRVRGNGTKAVAVTTYGGRSADSSLAELCGILECNGFALLGAGSFVTQHAMCPALASGRPDDGDIQELVRFSESLAAALRVPVTEFVSVTDEVKPYYTPLKENGERASFLKAVPKVDAEKCISCGICAESCPMGSIEKGFPYSTVSICIKCHACIRKCPAGARYFDDPDLLSHIRMLEANFAGVRKKNETLGRF